MWYVTSNNSEDIPISLERIYHPMAKNWVARFTIDSEYFIGPDGAIKLDDGKYINEEGNATSTLLKIGKPLTIHWVKNDLETEVYNDGGKAHISREQVNLQTAIYAANAREAGQIPWEITYVGIVKSAVSNRYSSYVVVTGPTLRPKSKLPKQTVQKSVALLSKDFFNYGITSDESLDMAKELIANGMHAQTVDDSALYMMGGLSMKLRNFIENAGDDALQKLEFLRIAVSMSPTGTVILGESSQDLDTDSYKKEASNIGANFIELPLENLGYHYKNISAIEYTENRAIIWL